MPCSKCPQLLSTSLAQRTLKTDQGGKRFKSQSGRSENGEQGHIAASRSGSTIAFGSTPTHPEQHILFREVSTHSTHLQCRRINDWNYVGEIFFFIFS